VALMKWSVALASKGSPQKEGSLKGRLAVKRQGLSEGSGAEYTGGLMRKGGRDEGVGCVLQYVRECV